MFASVYSRIDPTLSTDRVRISTESGSAYVVTRSGLVDNGLWRQSFEGQCKDHRYYEIIETTLQDEFTYHYLVLEDDQGRERAVQPFFFVNQDMTEGLSSRFRPIVRAIRRVFPRFLMMKMLMVGCAAGESHLGLKSKGDAEWAAESLHASLRKTALHYGASAVVLKDFPSHYRPSMAPFSNNGYVRVASMPTTRLPLDFADFDDYMQNRLSGKMRKNLRAKFRKSEKAVALEMSVVNDITPFIDEAYPLYEQVFERATMRFERLSRDYFCRIGQTMPERARFFIWRQSGKMVAFSFCLVHDNTIYDEYIGLDYAVALDLHLYFITYRDIINWAVAHGLKVYASAPLNYEPKLHLRCLLAPLDLYVTHSSSWINPFFRRLVRWLAPVGHDPVLRRFGNADEL
jgi:predicted N-acyltransferase